VIRFKVDENLPLGVAALLREAGHDAVTVLDQDLTGADDPALAAVCVDEARAIVTLDVGFGNIQAYPPSECAGIVVLRLRRQDRDTILALVRALLPALDEHELSGRLWVVDERRIRIRK